MEITLNNFTLFSSASDVHFSVGDIQNVIREKGFNPDDFYLVSNGKLVACEDHNITGQIHVIPRLLGGKGGFGSMLRAIGAQIEKTTNREACRDLSGRRLRDINEEERLKNWISQQADREKEAKERKQKKLERLCEQPKHEFKDEQYDAERSALPEKVEDAVLKGLEASASCSSGIAKRKIDDKKNAVKKKKPKLWVDDELDDLSSSEELDSEEEEKSNLNESNVNLLKEQKEENGAKESNVEQDNKECSVENEEIEKPEDILAKAIKNST